MVRKAFGGVKVSFEKVKHLTLKDVFGRGEMTPAEMVKVMWALIKKHDLRVS